MSKKLVAILVVVFFALSVVAAMAAAAKIGDKVKCAVDGKEITVKADTVKFDYLGATYYFCTAEEKALFEKDPAKYLKPVVPAK